MLHDQTPQSSGAPTPRTALSAEGPQARSSVDGPHKVSNRRGRRPRRCGTLGRSCCADSLTYDYRATSMHASTTTGVPPCTLGQSSVTVENLSLCKRCTTAVPTGPHRALLPQDWSDSPWWTRQPGRFQGRSDAASCTGPPSTADEGRSEGFRRMVHIRVCSTDLSRVNRPSTRASWVYQA